MTRLKKVTITPKVVVVQESGNVSKTNSNEATSRDDPQIPRNGDSHSSARAEVATRVAVAAPIATRTTWLKGCAEDARAVLVRIRKAPTGVRTVRG